MNEAIEFTLWVGEQGFQFNPLTNGWKDNRLVDLFPDIEMSTLDLYNIWKIEVPKE